MTEERKELIINIIKKNFYKSVLKSGLLFLGSGLVLLAIAFKFKSIPSFLAYIAYAICFFNLIVFSGAVIRDGIPWLINFGEQLPIVGQLIKNIRYRQRFFLYMGGIGNFIFLIFYFSVAYIYQSTWFYVIGIYNMFIALTRGYLSRAEHRLECFVEEKKKPLYESVITRNAALIIFLANSVIGLMGCLIIFKDDTFQYHFIILYALALYVFIRLTVIIVTLVQNKPHYNGIWKVVQLTNLVTATVSMFTFQTALLHNYEPDIQVRERYNAITGLLVFLINQGIVIWLLFRSKRIKKNGEKQSAR